MCGFKSFANNYFSLVSNSSVERSEKRSRPVGLRLAILFMMLSASIGLLVSIINLWKPFTVPFHLMGEPDFTAPNGVVEYALSLVLILVFNVPLLYVGIATAFSFNNAATSFVLALASALFCISAWGLYRFKNWARLLSLAISVFTFLLILGSFPPFFFHSFASTTGLLPYVVPYRLMVFYFTRKGVRQLFA